MKREDTHSKSLPVARGALASSIAEVEALSNSEDRDLTVSECESMMLVLHELRRLQAVERDAVEIVTSASNAQTASVLTDAQILALNAGEIFFSESPTRYPEAGHGTQYHAGVPGVIKFARAVLAADPTRHRADQQPIAWEYYEEGTLVNTYDSSEWAEHAKKMFGGVVVPIYPAADARGTDDAQRVTMAELERKAIAKSVFGGINALRWILNITTEFDRKDVRTRQAARLLDEYFTGAGTTNRTHLEHLWKTLKDALSLEDTLECLATRDIAPIADVSEDPIRKFIAAHAEQLDQNDYAYFELAYTRHTSWMAWLCSNSRDDDPNRKVLAKGQGHSPEEACEAALASMGGEPK